MSPPQTAQLPGATTSKVTEPGSTSHNATIAPGPAAARVPTTTPLVGEVVYMFAYDVAYEMTRKPVRELLGQPVAQFVVDASKRSPRQLFFYRPQMVRLPPLEKFGPRGPVRMERIVKILHRG